MHRPVLSLDTHLQDTSDCNERLRQLGKQLNLQISHMRHQQDKLKEQSQVNQQGMHTVRQEMAAVGTQSGNIKSQADLLLSKWQLKSDELDTKIAEQVKEQKQLQNNLSKI